MIKVLALFMLLVVMGGCVSRPVSSPVTPRTFNTTEAVSCDQTLMYETADDYPRIKWISIRPGMSQNTALSCLLHSDADDGTLELKAYLSSGLYRFVRECSADETHIYRLFEYKNKGRPYLLRLHTNQFVDPKTYVVVGSYRKPGGNYQHHISEGSNDASKLRNCQVQ